MHKTVFVTVFAVLAALLEASPANLLMNPSFEHGREPWITLAAPGKPYWNDFSVAADPKDPARKSARLELSSEHAGGRTGIWGAVQEVRESARIPRYLRGRYFVEEWRRGTAKQYVQVVFNVWLADARFGKTDGNAHGFVPVQLAFVLGGIAKPPFVMTNRKFVFPSLRDPPVGEWIGFEFDLRAAFASEHKFIPEKFSGFRVLLEVRFDDRAEKEKSARAIVYFDDLYLGDEGSGTESDSGELHRDANRPSVQRSRGSE